MTAWIATETWKGPLNPNLSTMEAQNSRPRPLKRAPSPPMSDRYASSFRAATVCPKRLYTPMVFRPAVAESTIMAQSRANSFDLSASPKVMLVAAPPLAEPLLDFAAAAKLAGLDLMSDEPRIRRAR